MLKLKKCHLQTPINHTIFNMRYALLVKNCAIISKDRWDLSVVHRY